jgi:SH3 domain-containing YSC84-like protein 1
VQQGNESNQRRRIVIMKKFMLLVVVLSLGCLAWAGSARQDAVDRLNSAATVLHEIMQAPDNGIPEEVLENAKCVAVVPHLMKGGFIVGAEHGKGVATCRTAKGWSAPAFITVSGGSVGFQIGIEGVDLVMIIQHENGMQKLLSSDFKLGADASVAAGPVGRHASASTSWKLDAEVLTYSRTKGAFAGIALDGASVRQDDDSTRAMYGKKISTRAALTGQVAAPRAANTFLDAVRGAKGQAAAKAD